MCTVKSMEVSKTNKPKPGSLLLIGIPGPGLIGTLSLTYIIHSLKMDYYGEIQNSPSTVIFVDNGQIIGPIRIYKKDKIFAILSDVPIDYELSVGFTESVIDFVKKNSIETIVFLTGIHVSDKKPENLKTYGLVTNDGMDSLLYENDIPKFLSGAIAGPESAVITYLKNSGISTLILLTECNFFFPDPESAMHTIQTLSKILKIPIDLADFKKQIDFLRLQNRQLMEETLNVMQQEKDQSSVPPQIYK
mgnify:CR=1 FL=1